MVWVDMILEKELNDQVALMNEYDHMDYFG
jgi:hypothetical protein